MEELIEFKKAPHIRKKIPLSEEMRKNIILLIFTLLSFIIVLAIFFLLATSQSLPQGYIYQQEQSEIKQNVAIQEDLNNKIIETQSSKTIEQSDIVKKMTKPENIIYIEPKNTKRSFKPSSLSQS